MNYIKYKITIYLILFIYIIHFPNLYAGNIDIIYSKKYEEYFNEMYADPTNLEKTFKFAEEALKSGDFEGAIGALERMLLINPNLPKIRLELGKLYLRLKSFSVAGVFFKDVIESKSASDELKVEAEQFLSQSKKLQSSLKASHIFIFGGRYQSNANSAPKDNNIILFGVPATLGDNSTSQQDFDISVTGISNLELESENYEWLNYSGTFVFYGNEQLEQTALNAKLIDVNLGLKINRDNFYVPLKINPYTNFSYLNLSDDELFYSYGFGINVDSKITESLGISGKLDRKLMRFNDISGTGSETSLNGDQVMVGLDFSYIPKTSDLIKASLLRLDEDTKDRKDSSITNKVSLNYQISLKDKDLKFLKNFNFLENIIVMFDFSAGEKVYQDIDFSTDIFRKRKDYSFAGGVNLNYQLNEELSVAVKVQRTENRSNIDNFDYINNSISFEATYSF